VADVDHEHDAKMGRRQVKLIFEFSMWLWRRGHGSRSVPLPLPLSRLRLRTSQERPSPRAIEFRKVGEQIKKTFESQSQATNTGHKHGLVKPRMHLRSSHHQHQAGN
jgi:hypothetical protein